MKKLLILMIAMTITLGCDDGNITVQNITFPANAAVQKCPNDNTLYLINENEALLIQINTAAAFNELIQNDQRTSELPINASNKVIYRFYNGKVAAANFCGGSIPPISPIAVGEWIAASGTISVTTTQVLSEPSTENNSTKITGYTHTISLKNVDFVREDGVHQQYENFPYGNLSTSATTLPFNFAVLENAGKCPTSALIYNAVDDGIEGLTVNNISATLLQNVEGVHRELIGDTINVLQYRLFASPFDGPREDFFCGTAFAAADAFVYSGVPFTTGSANDLDATGIIEVTTTAVGSVFRHTIVLKKVTFAINNSFFYLGDSYDFGVILTN